METDLLVILPCRILCWSPLLSGFTVEEVKFKTKKTSYQFLDVLLTVHLNIFILVINQLDVQNLFYNKFTSCLYKFRAPCAHRQEVKIVLYSLWYHHTYRWPSGAQEPVLSQPVHRKATYRCGDTRSCIIQF